MEKVQILKAGGYDQLQFVSENDPKPQNNEILIRVIATGVNYADVCVRLGVYESAKTYVGWPITPGFEVSGEVEAVGSQVKNFKMGDKVIGFTRFNGYSTKIALPEDQVMKLPKGFQVEEAAGFPAVFLTAYYALKQIIIIREGSAIVVHSAAGGVGTALVQLAKAMKLKVVGVVGSSHKVDYVKKLGADLVLDKSKDPQFWEKIRQFHPEGYDVVFDANGYSTYKKSYDVLKPTGKLVVYGSHSLMPKSGGRLNYIKAGLGLLRTPKFDPLKLITDNKSVIGFNVSFLFDMKTMIGEAVADLYDLADRGELAPVLPTYFNFKEVAKAHQLIESGQSVGKIILKM